MNIVIKNQPKNSRFFEYLLELTKLNSTVIRDYTNYEKYWNEEEFLRLEGVSVNKNIDDENFIEIHKPTLSSEEKKHPEPSESIKTWLDFKVEKETERPKHLPFKKSKDNKGNEFVEYFEADATRKEDYLVFVEKWLDWAQNILLKKKVIDFYNQFFELATRFDREGETLELVFGRGLFVWKHPQGLIRGPLITQKLEITLYAEKNIITIAATGNAIKQETEMFSGIPLHNKEKAEAILNSVSPDEMKRDLEGKFTNFIRSIHADGEFYSRQASVETTSTPKVFDQNVYVLRKKTARVLRDDLESILKELANENLELNEAIQSLLGEETRSSDSEQGDDSSKGLLPKDILFFPLESNEQQKEIVKRINSNYGVTVQGPPGTGKTHTIANLVSHFLAEGKKVLITSQKENPLRVLKNKIPEDIRDLCVPVLGGGKDSILEIEKSINTISEKLGELDSAKLEKEIKRNLSELDKSYRKEMELFNQLRVYSEREGTVLHYKGEELFKYDVAKLLAETDSDYTWYLDDISINAVFPLNQIEFDTLQNLQSSLNQNELILNDKELPDISTEIMDESTFVEFISEGSSLGKGKEDGELYLKQYGLPTEAKEIQYILQIFKILLDRKEILTNKSNKLIFEDLKSGGAREERWRNFSKNVEQYVSTLLLTYNQLIGYDFDLPAKPLSEIRADIEIAKQRLATGKKADFFFYLGKGKHVKYLFETSVLNQRPLESIEDVKIIEIYLNYISEKNEVARIYNANMNEIGHEVIDSKIARFPQNLQERYLYLTKVIETYDEIQKIEEKLNLSSVDLYSLDHIGEVVERISQAHKYLSYCEWETKYNNHLKELKAIASNPNKHVIYSDFIEAFKSKNIETWKQLITNSIELYEIQDKVKKFYNVLDKLKSVLPLTAAKLESVVGTDFRWPLDYETAFELRKLKTWLDENSDINSTKLRKLIDKEKTNQRQLLKLIVRDASWKSQVERITDNQKRALSAWKTSIKRYGAGTGKNKRFLKNIREAMVEAQNAIPVWIMPIGQVLENFPVTNEKFDVVIFDESSQCDLFSINVLLRGKKAIVVGDDEQISPQSVGINHDDIMELQRKYLSDIPNAELLDGNISLYEIAEQTFPKAGKLMLREHFRCVPEIIQFSNDLSYSGQMIPMRLPLESEKIDPPVMAIKVNDGYNDHGDKDINLPEAEKIAEDISKIINDPIFSGQTIGVITLQGDKQHKLLENLIREKIGDAEYVARKIICGNAYNLQGDERDIILLSMVVAPNRRFMTLSKQADKQRYNVAASRARNQMRLYHSVDLNDLSQKDYRYAFLAYCKNPNRVKQEFEDLESLCDSPFEKDVLKMILAKGYRVTPQVKVGGYRIDLVVEGVRDRLAVECDGERWHGPDVFESDMIRQASLERSGWKFWRVRGREFYFDRISALDSLWEKLDELGIEPQMHQPHIPDEEQTDVALSEQQEGKLEKVQSENENRISNPSINLRETIPNGQISLFENKEQPDIFNSDYLLEFVDKNGLKYVDMREKGGSFWIVGNEDLKATINTLNIKGYNFYFTSKGSRATKHQPGWYSKNN